MTDLGNEIALQAMVDALTEKLAVERERSRGLEEQNADLRAQIRKTSLLPPPLDDLPSPRDATCAVEFPSIDACLPTANQEGV